MTWVRWRVGRGVLGQLRILRSSRAPPSHLPRRAVLPMVGCHCYGKGNRNPAHPSPPAQIESQWLPSLHSLAGFLFILVALKLRLFFCTLEPLVLAPMAVPRLDSGVPLLMPIACTAPALLSIFCGVGALQSVLCPSSGGASL